MPIPALLTLLALPALAQTPPAATPPSSPAPSVAPASAPEVGKASVPRFVRTPVPGCGCALYAPPGIVLAPTKSDDGQAMWTGDVAIDGGFRMGAVVVKFTAPMEGTPEQLEELLVQYMAFLQEQLGITAAVGVGRGHTHGENAGARGVIDYWKDKDGDDWAVKGWVDRDRLAVLFLYGKGAYPYFTAQQLFLDGFRFKE